MKHRTYQQVTVVDARTPEQVESDHQITDHVWDAINIRMAGVTDLLENTNNEDLGALFREYIEEAGHGGWDGFELEQLLGIGAFLQDLALYHEALV